MACWDRLSTSGMYLCLSPWGFLERRDGCKRHPANLFYLFHPWVQLQLWGALHLPFEMQRLDQSQRKIQWAVKHKHICPQLMYLDKAKLLPVKLCGFVAAEEVAQQDTKSFRLRMKQFTSIFSSWRLFESGRMAKLTPFLLGSEVKNGVLSSAMLKNSS